MNNFSIYIPTRTMFGAGRVKELHKQQLPGQKAMIVISNGRSTKENGYLNIVEAELKQAGVETVVFDRVEPNLLKSTVMAGATFARENGCDFLVALGGGSVMDASKAMAFMATHPGDVWDYIHGGTGKGQPMQNKLRILYRTPCLRRTLHTDGTSHGNARSRQTGRLYHDAGQAARSLRRGTPEDE